MHERSTRLLPQDPPFIGAYQLAGRLGEGGMGVVYEARARDGRRVAVKVVHAELARDPGFRARFRSEVARARQVPPFCTAEVLDADPDAPLPYLVVEFVDGPSLADQVRRFGPLSPAHLHGLAIGVATALDAIHRAGVVHRDLKPHNVLLAPGSPKVIDFGIAQALDPTAQYTRTGEVVGTVDYMAPERFGAPGTPVTPAADVFAWGCVVAYAGQGRAPFDADSPMGVLARILGGDPALHGLTGSLRSLVEWALDPEPGRRPTARELVEALVAPGPDRAVAEQQPTARTERFTPTAPVTRRRPGSLSKALIGTVAVLALTLAGGLGFAVRAGSDLFPASGPAAPSPAPRPPSLVVPAGTLKVADPLTAEDEWPASEVANNRTYCRYAGGRLQVRTHRAGAWSCQGPSPDLEGGFAVVVTGRIEIPTSCLSVLFTESDQWRYSVEVCEDVWRLIVADQGQGDPRVVREWPDPATDTGQDIRLQMVMQNGVARIGHDGVLIGEHRIGPGFGVRSELGVTSAPAVEQGPFQVSYAGAEVHALG